MGRPKTGNYLLEAKREFCSGTPYTVPVDVVAAGVKSLQEWCVVLAAARALYGVRDLKPYESSNKYADPDVVYSNRDWHERGYA